MSETQISALDHTIQITNAWLKELEEAHHIDGRHHCYSALRAVLKALRDRLTPEQAVHFGAQLPILIRGIYFEGWRLDGTSQKDRHIDEFLAHVAAELPPAFPRDAIGITKAVFELLWKELDPGEVVKVVGSLPVPLRSLWPSAAQR